MDDPERTLYCGNLSADITEEIVYELFLQAGPVERVKIPKERDGRFRSYAFVTFRHEVSVPYAIDLLNGTKLFGRQLRLQSRSAGSGEGSGDSRGYNRSQSCSAHNFQRNNGTRAHFGYGHNNGNEAGSKSTEFRKYERSGSPDIEEVTIGSDQMNDSRNDSSMSRRPTVGDKRLAMNASYRGMHQVQPVGNWQNRAAPNQWQNMGNGNSSGVNGPMWINGAQQVVTFTQPDTSAIFDPVIEQKMRERLLLIQQEDQVKRMQQFMQNQRLGPYHPFHRSENTWWQ